MSLKCFLKSLYHRPVFRKDNRQCNFHSYRSSHRRCSVRKDVLRNFAKLSEKHLCHSLVFNKVAGLRPKTLLKKRL